MSKRNASELLNNTKRARVDDVMPPPRNVPLQKSTTANVNLKLKPQASVADPKTTNLIDDDSDDEELWIRASQIEQKVLAMTKENNANVEIDFSYSEFRTNTQQLLTSTQVIDLTGNSGIAIPKIDPKIQILQNKCAALEKQLKKYRPTAAEMSQKANELSELKEKIKKLSSENDELRNEKLRKEVESVSCEDKKLKIENEKLKKVIEQLMRDKKNKVGNCVQIIDESNSSFNSNDSNSKKNEENLKRSGSNLSRNKSNLNRSKLNSSYSKLNSSQVQTKTNSSQSKYQSISEQIRLHTLKTQSNFKQPESNSTSNKANISIFEENSSQIQPSFTKNSSNFNQIQPNDVQLYSHKNQLNIMNVNQNQSNSNHIKSTSYQFREVLNKKNQASCTYKNQKFNLWNEDTEFLFLASTDNFEIVDLISKTENLKIFQEKNENSENLFTKKYLKLAKQAQISSRFIQNLKTSLKIHHRTTSTPQIDDDASKFDQLRTRSAKSDPKNYSKNTRIPSSITQISEPQPLTHFDISKHSNNIKNSSDFFNDNFCKNSTQDSPEIAILKLLITKIQSNLIEKLPLIDINDTFNEILKIFIKISASVKDIEMRRWNEHFMKQEFACKQAQYFSEQYFADREFKILSKCDESDLINHRKLFEDEMRVEERRLIAMIAIICKNSPELSEKILTQNISTISEEFRTVIDEICEMIDPYIIQSRFLYKNSGLTMALCEIICSISIHYEKFRHHKAKIDELLFKFFNHLLTMSTNSPKILIRLTKFLINISKNPEFNIISNFCINFPSANLEFSKMFKIYQIPRSSCLLQIYFCLLASVFNYTEDIYEHRIEDLLELAMSLNKLVDIFMANAEKLDFLKANLNVDGKKICKCYQFLTIGLLTLNEQVLRHRNSNSDQHFYKVRRITKIAVINITKLFSLSRKTVAFWNFNFAHNMMNDINMKINHDQIDINGKFFTCKDVLLSTKGHDDFLKRLRVKTRFQDEENSFIGGSQSDVELNVSVKEVNSGLKKSLLEESVDCFKEKNL